MTQLELKLANSNSGSCRTSTILVVFSGGTSPVEKVFFCSVLMMKPHRACTHDRQSFCQPSSIYSTGWCTVWRTLRKTLTMIFAVVSSVLHNENHVLHPLLPERNDHGYELRRRRHERGLTMPNAISFTDSYINIGLAITFLPANILLFNYDLSIYNKRICYAVWFQLICIDENTQVCTATIVLGDIVDFA